MDPAPKLIKYGSGRYVPTLVGDPGPLPLSDRRLNPPERVAFLSDAHLERDESLDRAWSAAVREVRATGDVQAILALRKFHSELRRFLGHLGQS